MAFSVSIINIENNINNLLLTDDLTIELLKVRYNWILNATIRNVVLGLDDYGLVWYMGEWICGEWEDGTWYSGIWHDGIWKNGRWYSYLMDRGKVLTRQYAVIEEDKMYSQFLNGKWMNGVWYNGIFGNDNSISGSTNTQILNNSNLTCPYWYTGNFYKGLFKNSVWKSGVWFGDSIDSNFLNSYWINGKFYNGKFDNFEWWDGSFFGGDFVQGYWKTGIFNQLNTNILARFGTLTGTTTLSTWANGLFENGQFMSGYNYDDSGNTIASSYHNVSHWKNGIFNNGFWYGGHFEKGNFNYGSWFGGIFNTQTGSTYLSQTTWKNGIWYDGLWLNGVFKSGFFYGGMWLDGVFENGFLVSEYTGTFTNDLKTNIVPVVLPPIPPPPTYHTPIVTLLSTTNITFESCSVQCEVIDDGGLATVRGICYSKTSQPTINNSKIYDENTGIGTYSCTMIELNENTNYYVRAFASNSLGISYSSISMIHTPISPLPKVVTNGTVGTITTQANLEGKITSIGLASINQYGFIYSTDFDLGGDYLIAGPPPTIGANQIYQKITPPLSYNTKYYFVAYAINSYGTGVGQIMDFTTTTGPPTVETAPVINITQTTAQCGGNVISDGGESVTARGVCWSHTNPLPTTSNSHTSDGIGLGTFTSTLTGLNVGDIYYVRAYATNSKGTSYGMVDSFVCQSGLASITTKEVTLITQTGATCGGIVTDDNGSPVSARGVCWNTTGNPTVSLPTKTTNGSGTGTFTSLITGLSNNTTYYVKAYATNGNGTAYGAQKVFTTLGDYPTVTTTAISNITNNSAQSGGNVTSSGGGTITARGVCWALTSNPTIANSKTNNGTGTGSYTSILTGLANNTTYHVRAYATNSLGTSYGADLSFTTLTSATVTTSDATSITSTTATTGGNVTSDGGSPVTLRGVCYSTTPSPTTSNNPYSGGSGTGSFTVNLSGLTAGVTYYFKAFAINAFGTSYGSQKTFTTGTVPTVITYAPTNITNTGTTSGGDILSDGGSSITEKGCCIATHPNPTTSDLLHPYGAGMGSWTQVVNNLTHGTHYYIRAYAKNVYGTGYGNEYDFWTLTIPSVTTGAVDITGRDWDVLNNQVTATGGYPVVDRGVCWATHTNPTISNSHTHDGSGLGFYDSSCTGNFSTTYYLRAYATNPIGTGYGDEEVFTTDPHP